MFRIALQRHVSVRMAPTRTLAQHLLQSFGQRRQRVAAEQLAHSVADPNRFRLPQPGCPQVLKDNTFASISVTAERWIPVLEVKEAALLAWLEVKASEGYSLVGLEQTAESVCLPDYEWPERCVLVLGREKEGLPPEVRRALLRFETLGGILKLTISVTW